MRFVTFRYVIYLHLNELFCIFVIIIINFECKYTDNLDNNQIFPIKFSKLH